MSTLRGQRERLRAAALLATALLVGLIGARAVAGDESSAVQGESGSLLEKRLKPGSETTQASVISPLGGSPFGVALSRTDDGLSCVSLGRVKGGRVVIPTRGAPDVAATEAKAGLCHRLEDLTDAAPVVYDKQWRFYDEETGARDTTTRFFGMVKRNVRRLTLHAAGESIDIPLSQGTFVVAFAGAALIDGFKLDVEFADGQHKTMQEPPMDGRIRDTLLNPPTGSRIDELDRTHP